MDFFCVACGPRAPRGRSDGPSAARDATRRAIFRRQPSVDVSAGVSVCAVHARRPRCLQASSDAAALPAPQPAPSAPEAGATALGSPPEGGAGGGGDASADDSSTADKPEEEALQDDDDEDAILSLDVGSESSDDDEEEDEDEDDDVGCDFARSPTFQIPLQVSICCPSSRNRLAPPAPSHHPLHLQAALGLVLGGPVLLLALDAFRKKIPH
jgi:hypothetical protein